jgi:DNA polymerase III gamma/tau subunit
MLSELHYQDRAATTLRRVIDGTLTSPLLLLGSEGVGRKHSVVCMMRELLCAGDRTASCACASCFQIAKGIHPDILIVGSEAERVGVDAVRAVIAAVQEYPTASPFTCVVIDGADNFASGDASDMLLKALEEPASRTRYFLLAERRESVSPTIRSRCVEVWYRNLPAEFIVSMVSQKTRDANALVYGRMGEGSLGRALQYAYSGKLSVRDHMLKLLEAVAARDLAATFSLADSAMEDANVGVRVVRQLLEDIILASSDPDRAINVDLQVELRELGARSAPEMWLSIWTRVHALQEQMRTTRVAATFHLKSIFAETFV